MNTTTYSLQRCPCGCGKFDHNAYQPVAPCTFSTPAPRHQPLTLHQPALDNKLRR
jgi:hypothetical protein